MDIHAHGIIVDKERYRVQCKYCGKEMSGLHRLKRHLGGIGPDVLPCKQVTSTAREMFRNVATKEKLNVTATETKRVGEVQLGNRHKRERREDSSRKSESAENGNAGVEANKHDLLSNEAQKCIGRHFYENCFDFSIVDSPSFREMLRATTVVGGGEMRLKIPDSHDLDGWMLQKELKEVQDHVKKIKRSWAVIAKIGRQLKMYRLDNGCFNEASQPDQITGIAPAEWWAQKASQNPELQSFAIKILSQTCEGASRYKLKRSVAEKLLLTRGMSRLRNSIWKSWRLFITIFIYKAAKPN